MRKRVHIALAVVLVIFAGVIGWQVLRLREPVYEGHPLSFWLENLTLAPSTLTFLPPEQAIQYIGPNTHFQLQSAQAIQHIGTNALPFLIKRLQAQDSRLEVLMLACAAKLKFVGISLKTTNQRRWAALNQRRFESVLAYRALGPAGSSQVPSISEVLAHTASPDVRQAAVNALGFIGPQAKLAAPALFNAAKDTERVVRMNAFWALGQIRPDPHLTIPVLIAGLNDPVIQVQNFAAGALIEYGQEAKAAVPALLRMSERNSSGADAASSALKAIDPEAAARAGVR